MIRLRASLTHQGRPVRPGVPLLEPQIDVVRDVIEEGFEDAGVALVERMVGQVRAGQTPDGGQQRRNEPETAAHKRRTLGHDTPLVGREQILSDPSRYRVTIVEPAAQGGEVSVEITPPAERRAVIGYLRDKGYSVFEMPAGSREIITDAIREARRRRGAR